MSTLKLSDVIKIVEFDTSVYINEISNNIDTEEITIKVGFENSFYNNNTCLAGEVKSEKQYLQGVDQFFSSSASCNTDPASPLVFFLYLPDDLVLLYKIIFKVKAEKFRTYNNEYVTYGETLTSSENERVEGSTLADGGIFTELTPETTTKSFEGAVDGITDFVGTYNYNTDTTNSNYYKAEELGTQQDIIDIQNMVHTHKHPLAGPLNNAPSHYHNFVSTNTHYHNFFVKGHTHYISGHRHKIRLSQHRHSINVSHGHVLLPGYFKYGNPSEINIKIDGISSYVGASGNIDLTSFFREKKTYYKIEINANDLSFIKADFFVYGYIK